MKAAQRHALIALARGHRAFGWAGWIGLGLAAASAIVLASGWIRHQDGLARAAQAAAPSGPTAVPARSAVSDTPAVKLPPRDSIPTLLSRIERAALDQGLEWPRADYRTTNATAEAPASIEIRCTLKGPYPAIRRFLAALLLDTPALTFKELALNRANAESAEVETRLAIVIYLAEPTAPATGAAP
jgi:hypothetical protein